MNGKIYNYTNNKYGFCILILSCFIMISCHEDNFVDTGIPTNSFDGVLMEYLQGHPENFALTSKAIELADLVNEVTQNGITFFAPVNGSIIDFLGQQFPEADIESMHNNNAACKYYVKDATCSYNTALALLEEIPTQLLRENLEKYIVSEQIHMWNPEINRYNIEDDPIQVTTIGGQTYTVSSSLPGSDISFGYRYLLYNNVTVSTKDIQTDNAIVHILWHIRGTGAPGATLHVFGF